MKPLNKVKIQWSPEFAYALGLLVTDGNLSPDGRHINFTSKDEDLVRSFKKCLNLSNKIGKKSREKEKIKRYHVVQFGDIKFYEFLLKIGLMPNKSKKLSDLEIPKEYFFDFLRGHFDGDGTFYSYWDPRWKHSFMFYTVFVSASKPHIEWLRRKIRGFSDLNGYVTKSRNQSIYELRYAKKESLRLLKKIYYSDEVICLSRKRLKVQKALAIIGEKL
ncbi:MAG: Intein-containing protein [Candidatus Jorgensenbacteria bacterium GW2011_GWA1_48_11]|uniref:Intein-containing protein n=1 Tax=Candidatus Jorgensenbacteria bacterium GW2011_GWA1_48_11 TaxID=1618660 RepID=A0A0G1X8W9_9BACT|nr:MAG: Intein-containing protein [Candidatus Jorgensenbacteria bacterium GW2011_GWA1_48_11]KKW12398.1 MAG: Intein-containing protein [Candidatus Jorgensenbacteria bacterium GW2011_GWB1_49_9]